MREFVNAYANGRLVERFEDHDDDEFRVESYVWDDEGRLLEQTFDYDGDGAADLTLRGTFSADHLQTLEFTSPSYHSLESWSYDAGGRVTLVEKDVGVDGDVDSVRTYSYTGDATEADGYVEDEGPDGVIDASVAYSLTCE